MSWGLPSQRKMEEQLGIREKFHVLVSIWSGRCLPRLDLEDWEQAGDKMLELSSGWDVNHRAGVVGSSAKGLPSLQEAMNLMLRAA